MDVTAFNALLHVYAHVHSLGRRTAGSAAVSLGGELLGEGRESVDVFDNSTSVPLYAWLWVLFSG